MARRCFEVNQLEICFWREDDRIGKFTHVSAEMGKFLNKYASNTTYKISSRETHECDPSVTLTIKFSKNISVITVINFLSYLDVGSYSSIVIKEKENKVVVEVLK